MKLSRICPRSGRSSPAWRWRCCGSQPKLGLPGISVPEKFGGMEMDLPSVMVVAEVMGRDGSYAGWHGAHTGIGSLPILFFGTEQQKEKYLPRLARPSCWRPMRSPNRRRAPTRWPRAHAPISVAGRQALHPQRPEDVDHQRRRGRLFTVFAKVGGEKFTAFIVERAFGGVTSGAEEHKMGIQGSSTTAIYFDNVKVPVENVLGEIGRGHVIAFNILNIGRLKLGPAVMGGAKNILAHQHQIRQAAQGLRHAHRRASARFSTSWRRWRSGFLPPNPWPGAWWG